MGDAIDRELSIGQTTIHVVSGKLPQDAGGVSRDISEAAGEGLRQDARKWRFPLTIGSTVVTGAGRLSAK